MDNKNNDCKTCKTIAIILISILSIIALYMIFFNDMSDNNQNDNMDVNIYNSANQMMDTAKDTIEIADENAKELYERAKNGITLDGKLIEVPANYMKKITDKVTSTGYKITNDTKTAINNKLDEIENIIRGEGKSDINELSQESQNKIRKIATEIENML